MWLRFKINLGRYKSCLASTQGKGIQAKGAILSRLSIYCFYIPIQNYCKLKIENKRIHKIKIQSVNAAMNWSVVC